MKISKKILFHKKKGPKLNFFKKFQDYSGSSKRDEDAHVNKKIEFRPIKSLEMEN